MRKAYLFVFNMASCMGWAYILVSALPYLSANPDYKALATKVKFPLQVVQTMALMEVIHAAIGLVRSKVFSTAIQVASRIMVVWFVFYFRDILRLTSSHYSDKLTIPYSADYEVGLLGCALSWSCVEVPRYLFYALSLYDSAPYALTWIRYSLFTILYPTGISSEVYSIWKMIKNVNPYIWAYLMPNAWNFEISYKQFMTLALMFYLPFAPFLYKHMISQRTKALTKALSSDKKDK